MFAIRSLSQLAPDRRQEAAALLFAHQSASDRAESINQWLGAIERNELNADTILTGWSDDCIVAIQVVEMLPGRSAAFWAIRSRPGTERIDFENQLLEAAMQMLESAGIKLAQCLLGTEDDAADAVLRNGFQRITAVQHMKLVCSTAANSHRAELTFQPFSDSESPTFQRVLMESFEGTLDCAEMNHLRTADEIMAGHRASAPDMDRWWLIHRHAEPIGVLILSDSPLPDYWDLAYLGLLPSFRGKGIGSLAVRFAIQQTVAASKEGLTLMVDERNVPAIRLYEKAGFECLGTRDVYLWKSPHLA